MCLVFTDPNNMVFVQFPDVMPGVPASHGKEEDTRGGSKEQVYSREISIYFISNIQKPPLFH